MTDENLMRAALRLAEKGRGRVSPNPMVGAILAKNGHIVGRGYHAKYGEEHAEVRAMQDADSESEDSTLYATLEPCSHSGNQPPCVDTVIESGVKRVVIGHLDPNPKVNGKGVGKLRNAGISTDVGVLEERCRELNRGFIKHIMTGLPFITLKIAQTLDGRIAAADGSSKWVTSEASRKEAHRMRSRHDAILVGIDTVLSDDPSLNVRLVRGVDPQRIVLDSTLRIPLQSKLLNESLSAKTIIVTTERADKNKVEAIRARGADVWVVRAEKDSRINLKRLCRKLGRAGITSVLVEGGARIFSSFLRSALVDEVAFFIAPKILGAGTEGIGDIGISTLANSIQFKKMTKRQFGKDLLLTGRIH